MHKWGTGRLGEVCMQTLRECYGGKLVAHCTLVYGKVITLVRKSCKRKGENACLFWVRKKTNTVCLD